MNPPAGGDTSAHRTRTNRRDTTAMNHEATSAPLAADRDVIDPPAPPRPAASHVRLQGAGR